jgi:hypothetical protein
VNPWFDVECFGIRPVIVKLQIKPGMMETPPIHFQQSLRKILTVILYAAVAFTVLGILLKTQEYSAGDGVLMASLSALSGCLFLHAFLLPNSPADSKPDLYAFILLKVLYIGSAVAVMGILFSILHLPGAPKMLTIGSSTTGIACVFSASLFVKNSDNWSVLKVAFAWGLAAALVSGYFIVKSGLV